MKCSLGISNFLEELSAATAAAKSLQSRLTLCNPVAVPFRSFPLSCLLTWQDEDSRLSPGEGNGTQFQYSCLENPMDGEAW